MICDARQNPVTFLGLFSCFFGFWNLDLIFLTVERQSVVTVLGVFFIQFVDARSLEFDLCLFGKGDIGE